MDKIVITPDDELEWQNLEEQVLSDHCTSTCIDVEEFKVKEDEIFLTVNGEVFYDSKFCERDGKVYFVDEQGEGTATKMKVSKAQLLELFQKFITK